MEWEFNAMPEKRITVRSSRTSDTQKRKRERPRNPDPFPNRQQEALISHLADEHQSLVRDLVANQKELQKENARLHLIQKKLKTSHEYSRSLLDAASVSLLALDRDGMILESNLAAASLLGLKPVRLVEKHFQRYVHSGDRSPFASSVQLLWETGIPQICEVRLRNGKNSFIPARLDLVLSSDRSHGSILLMTITNIAERRESELKQELAANVLQLLNRGSGDMTLIIREVLRLINESIGFDAVGLRLRRGDDFPYFEHNGFSKEFLADENYLCSRGSDGGAARDEDGMPVLECTCGLVLSGRTDSISPFFTEGGSFWTNKASELLSIPKEADPRTNPRNRCIHDGYESVALIPVHSAKEIIGLLQLNDRAEGRLSRGLVRFFEGLGDQIGLTLRRKQAEEALRQKQEDLNHAQAVGQIGSWRLDVGRNVLTWSDENHRIFGVPKGTPMTYETFLSVVHPDDRRFVDARWKAGLKGEPYDIEHRLLVNGSVKWVREKAYLEFDDKGKPLGGFGITQDITSRKQAEEELRVLNESLERRVAERSVVAEYRAEKLQKLTLELTLAEQRERQRLAMVLHDGLQQILVGSKIQLAFVERSQDMHQAIEQVSELIDEAIETSRSLSAELSPPILLQGDLVLAFEWLVRWMHRKYGLNIRLTAREKIRPLSEEIMLLLFQSLRELLFNIVKHAGVKNASVEVADRDGRIIMTVADRGRGFDPAQLRAEGGKSGGIGLFGIGERLSYLGGHMDTFSAPGKGSCFTMTIPHAILLTESGPAERAQDPKSPAAVSTPHPPQPEGKRRIRVLLADDHIVMRQGLSRLLRGEPDMEVIGEASDGQAAVGLIRELQPDVVLMDINMPGMDGIEAARIVHREYPHIPIIGLSMFQEHEQAEAMRRAGAVHYIAKSGPSDSVVSAIRDSVGAR
jgi:PAS domain S-box-containing protein